MRRATLSMMVNGSIAEEVQRIHSLPRRPLVIRNMCRFQKVDQAVCRMRRQAMCQDLGVPDTTFLVLYHGAIVRHRGVENIIRACASLEGVAVVLLGFIHPAYKQDLRDLAEGLGIAGRLLILDPVPSETLWQFVGAVDVGTALIENCSRSYYLSLPNKVFENIQAETPIVGSCFPEIEAILDQYQVGLCCDPHDPVAIAGTVDRMRRDPEMIARFKANLKVCKEVLCWEQEERLLRDAYAPLLAPRN